MADIRVPKIYEAKPNVKVKKLWLEQQIAEKECRVKRLEVDAEEIVRGRLKAIEADILMLKREISSLHQQYDELEKQAEDKVIDI